MSRPTIEWPKNKAGAEKADKFQLAVWYRFLPMCENEDQVEIINLIYDRFTAMGGFDPALSKAVGLDKSKYETPPRPESPIYCEVCGCRFFIDPKETYAKHLPYCQQETRKKQS